jgi:hypothetical protein
MRAGSGLLLFSTLSASASRVARLAPTECAFFHESVLIVKNQLVFLLVVV